MGRYTVKYERDESGWWIAEVREVQGCRTQGRSIAQARARIREALELFDVDPSTAELVDDVRLPSPGRRVLQRMNTARLKAEAARAAATAEDVAAVRTLTKDLGLSVRDVGEIVGLSFQRVQQLVEAAARRKVGHNGGAEIRRAKRADPARVTRRG